jgi:hypothetical protein
LLRPGTKSIPTQQGAPGWTRPVNVLIAGADGCLRG